MDIEMLKFLGSILAAITLQGGLLLAAAKTVFATKPEMEQLTKDIEKNNNKMDRRIYDDHGLPIYMLKAESLIAIKEIEKNNISAMKEMERHNTFLQENSIEKLTQLTNSIEKLSIAQEKTNMAILKLQIDGRKIEKGK